jgi:hypothetical protein
VEWVKYLNLKNYALPALNFTSTTASEAVDATYLQSLAFTVENSVESPVTGASVQIQKGFTQTGPWFDDGDPVDVTESGDLFLPPSQPIGAHWYRILTTLGSGEITQRIRVLGKGGALPLPAASSSNPPPPPLPWENLRSGYFNMGRSQIYTAPWKSAYAITTAASWAYWVKRDSTRTFESVVMSTFNLDTATGWFIGLGEVDFGTGTSNLCEYTLPDPDVWVHVVITWDGTNVRNYHDGVLIDTVANTAGSIGAGVRDIWFGQDSPPQLYRATLNYVGNMCEAAVFNKTLSLSEVQELYNGGTPFDYRTASTWSNNIGYWPIGLTADTVSTINDLSPQRNNLSVTMQTPSTLLVSASSQLLQGAASILDGLTEFTVMAFAGMKSESTTGYVLAKENYSPYELTFGMYTTTTGSATNMYAWDQSEGLIYAGRGQSFTASTTAQSYAWHNYALTVDGSTVLGYRDGTLLTSDFSSGGFVEVDNWDSEFAVGAVIIGGTPTAFFNGYMGPVCIWDKALTAAEIAELCTTIEYNTILTKDPRVNTGDYVSAANLIHMWLYIGSTNDLTVADGVQDQVGSEDLTAVNLTNASLFGVYIDDVP